MADEDHALARRLAAEAGDLLLRLRTERGFTDPAGLRAAGDRQAHLFLMEALAQRRPDDAVLSEEGADDPVRLGADRVWIVDPLDGTREFAEQGRSDWAVHVALWQRKVAPTGDPALVAGAVALPGRGLVLSTAPTGARLWADAADAEGSPLEPTEPARRRPLRVAVSRTRPPEIVDRLVAHVGERGIDVELVPLGSAGAKISAVLLGEVDAYVHGGGQYEWDSAAPAAVALAAGAHASRIDGSTLTYNREDPTLPDILVSHPEPAPLLLAGIRAVTETPRA